MTEGEAVTTQINNVQEEAFHTSSSTHQPSTDDILQHDEHVEESELADDDDVPLLTKKYVRLNFFGFI